MDAESFFSRWSRRKTEAKQVEEQKAPAQAHDAQPPAEKTEAPPPTMQDVDKLTHNSDFSPFVARQVDEIIRRAAMKKLFTDPHFNIMDGLDVYIEDYNKFEPLTPEALAELNHAEALLNPIVEPQHKLMQLLDLEPQDVQQDAPQDSQQQPGGDTSAVQETKAAAAASSSPPSPDTPPHDDKVQGL